MKPPIGLSPCSFLLLPVLVALVLLGDGGRVFAAAAGSARDGANNEKVAEGGNTWAVLVDTSMFWFNYRHASGTLGFYRTVRQLGVPDDKVVLMLAGSVPCDPRNKRRGRVFVGSDDSSEVYSGQGAACGDGIPEIDYRGAAVTVDALLGV